MWNATKGPKHLRRAGRYSPVAPAIVTQAPASRLIFERQQQTGTLIARATKGAARLMPMPDADRRQAI